VVYVLSSSIVAVASLGVLLSSDDVPNGEWHIPLVKKAQQPQVWLAFFSTLANSLLGYAFAEGLTINFWRLANRGTTVTKPTNPSPSLDDK
jgi:hypothetical protein